MECHSSLEMIRPEPTLRATVVTQLILINV
jgi:hypothetical protein